MTGFEHICTSGVTKKWIPYFCSPWFKNIEIFVLFETKMIEIFEHTLKFLFPIKGFLHCLKWGPKFSAEKVNPLAHH